MEKHYLRYKRCFIVFRVIFYALLFVLMFIDISCSQGRNKHKNASKDVEFVKNEINIDHFLIFKFDSNIEDVIQLLRAQKINYLLIRYYTSSY